jgi:P-type conjugative transfer protein TrbJ
VKKVLFLMLIFAPPALAGSVAGTGGSTEVTQIANNIQLANAYTQQVQQYAMQGLQFKAQLQNMMLNPASAMGLDVSKLVSGIGGIMQAGQSIGGTMTKIDGNFAAKFQSPLAGTFAQNFKTWTTTSQDTLGAALRAAGMHRDAYSTDTAALQALYSKTQSSQGEVAAVQTMSEINVMQVQQLQKLQDLLATQNVASSTWMATQAAKDQARQDSSTVNFKTEPMRDTKSYKSFSFDHIQPNP